MTQKIPIDCILHSYSFVHTMNQVFPRDFAKENLTHDIKSLNRTIVQQSVANVVTISSSDIYIGKITN